MEPAPSCVLYSADTWEWPLVHGVKILRTSSNCRQYGDMVEDVLIYHQNYGAVWAQPTCCVQSVDAAQDSCETQTLDWQEEFAEDTSCSSLMTPLRSEYNSSGTENDYDMDASPDSYPDSYWSPFEAKADDNIADSACLSPTSSDACVNSVCQAPAPTFPLCCDDRKDSSTSSCDSFELASKQIRPVIAASLSSSNLQIPEVPSLVYCEHDAFASAPTSSCSPPSDDVGPVTSSDACRQKTSCQLQIPIVRSVSKGKPVMTSSNAGRTLKTSSKLLQTRVEQLPEDSPSTSSQYSDADTRTVTATGPSDSEDEDMFSVDSKPCKIKSSKAVGLRKKGVSKKCKKVICRNCGASQTPQWRCGPEGPRTLCNACGVRYKKGLPLQYWEKKCREAKRLH